ncbi:MAG: hypothetical protein Fur0037_02810 [Planctomycetota bacterium]
MRIAAILAGSLAALLPAQQTKTVPSGMAHVEADNSFTYPFGRTDAKLQYLIDADQITLGQGVITGVAFRQNAVTASQTSLPYVKNYLVTAYQVQTAAAAMVADPVTNIGSAAGTVVFNGPLSVPGTAPTPTWPAPFGIQIPFTPPLVFNGTQGNLLLLIETADQAPAGGTFRLDSQTIRASTVTGIAAAIDASGCTAGGNSLSLATDPATAILGQPMQQTLTPSGAIGAMFALLGVVRQDLDLTPLGMPGCWSRVSGYVSQLALGSPAQITWTIPLMPALEGMPVFCQGFGLDASGLLSNSVTSNGQAIRIGSNLPPVAHADTAFYVASTQRWFKSAPGIFVAPVIELQGVFP